MRQGSMRREMEGRVCLVTGATSGIGLVTARALAERGADVTLLVRSPAKAEAVVAGIKEQTGNPNVSALIADLSVQAQVRRAAEQFGARHDRLHVLVNNAGGVFFGRRRESADGIEMTFALNHLAPFLLTNLLLETLKASAPARVVTVASAAHAGAHIPFDDVQHRRRYVAFGVYGETKLANILFTYELARRLDGTDVTANALHPGFVASNFGHGETRLWDMAFTLARPFAISTERGAQTSIYLATSPEVEGVSGRYFANQRPVRSSGASYDREAARRLWEVSEQLTGLGGATAQSA